MADYDICILAHGADSELAHRLGDSIGRYRLPGGIRAEGGYKRIVQLSAEGQSDTEAESLLARCRRLIVLCSPEARECEALCRCLLYF